MSHSTSLVRALDILTLLSSRVDGLTIAEIVDVLQQPRSNVVRIINTLIHYGLIERKNKRRLAPTRAFFELCMVERYLYLRRKYRHVLTFLSEEVNELVLLGLQEGNAIIHIDHIESDKRVRVAPSPTTRHDLERNAIGKIALSRRPDLMERYDNQAFHSEIEEVRRTGIAWNREETAEGVIVMACPGFSNSITEPIIAISWPKFRFREESAVKAKRLIDQAIAKERIASGLQSY